MNRLIVILVTIFLISPTTSNAAESKQQTLEKILAAASAGNADAQYQAGGYFHTGMGRKVDLKRQVEYYSMAARQGHAGAQNNLAMFYATGNTVEKDSKLAAQWYAKAAEQGLPDAVNNLGWMLAVGMGVKQDQERGLALIRKAVEMGNLSAENNLGIFYDEGWAVEKNHHTAVYWFQKAAKKGNPAAQKNLGVHLLAGKSVPKDIVSAGKWLLLAAQGGDEDAKVRLKKLQPQLTDLQKEKIMELASEFRPMLPEPTGSKDKNEGGTDQPKSYGTGFFVTDDGYLLTNHHVVKGSSKILVHYRGQVFPVRSLKYDALSDVAVLKIDARTQYLPLVPSRDIRSGDDVFTIGFPNVAVQGRAPKYTSGEINSMTGERDDPRFFQMSTQIQPGNSGGALVDGSGRVIGIVSKRLQDMKTLEKTGFLPQDVNYALKSSYVLAFLELSPEALNKVLSLTSARPRLEGEIASQVEAATAMVVTY